MAAVHAAGGTESVDRPITDEAYPPGRVAGQGGGHGHPIASSSALRMRLAIVKACVSDVNTWNVRLRVAVSMPGGGGRTSDRWPPRSSAAMCRTTPLRRGPACRRLSSIQRGYWGRRGFPSGQRMSRLCTSTHRRTVSRRPPLCRCIHHYPRCRCLPGRGRDLHRRPRCRRRRCHLTGRSRRACRGCRRHKSRLHWRAAARTLRPHRCPPCTWRFRHIPLLH